MVINPPRQQIEKENPNTTPRPEIPVIINNKGCFVNIAKGIEPLAVRAAVDAGDAEGEARGGSGVFHRAPAEASAEVQLAFVLALDAAVEERGAHPALERGRLVGGEPKGRGGGRRARHHGASPDSARTDGFATPRMPCLA